MLNKHRVAPGSGRVGSSPQRPAVQQERTGPLEGRVRSKDISAELLARIQAGGREYRAKHGNPFDWFERTDNPPRKAWERNISSQKTPPVETCPYCVKGITDDDAECSFCMGSGRLT
jgi:hypothetical protein